MVGPGAPDRAAAGRLQELTVVAGTQRAAERAGGVRRDHRPRPAGPVLAATTAAAAAALSGLAVVAAVVLVAWATDSRTGASAQDAVRFAADAWLLAHHGTLRLPSGTVAAVPLGLTVLPAVLLHRAGVSLARGLGLTELPPAGQAVALLAAGYGLLAALVARLAGTPAVAVGPVSAGLGAAGLAVLAGGLGAVRAGHLGPAVTGLLPEPVPAVARAAAAAVALLVAAGAALVVLGLAVHAGRAVALTRTLDPGLVGVAVLLLVGVLLAPNAVVWGAAYAAGPGFAVGAGTGVSPFGAALGPVPALPLLAALPQGATAAPALRVVLVLPVVAGVLAGVLVSRRLPAGTPTVGGGYLTAVGPSPWQVGLAVLVEVGAPAALTAALVPAAPAPAADGCSRRS